MARRARLSCDPLEGRLTPTDIAFLSPPYQVTYTPVAAAPTGDGGLWQLGSAVNTSPNQYHGYGYYPSDPVLIRLGADGSPDPSFNGGKPLPLPDVFRAGTQRADNDQLFVTPDGKLLAVLDQSSRVYAYAYGCDVGFCGNGLIYGPGTVVVRFNTDGTLDPTFGTGGVATIDFRDPPPPLPDGTVVAYPIYSGPAAADAALAPDGKIVLVASESYLGLTGEEPAAVAVVRLTADGQLDPTFDGDGRASIPFDPGTIPGRDDNTAYSVAAADVEVGPDGTVWVGASFSAFTYMSFTEDGAPISVTVSVDSAVGVARLTPDGALDSTFDADGLQFLDIDLGTESTTSVLKDMALTPDGGVIVVGRHVTKLLADGRLDPAFGTGGRLDPGVEVSNYSGVVVLPDGRIRVALSESTTFTSSVLGFLADGSPDPDFTPFRLAPASPSTGTIISELTLLSDGGLLVKGYDGETNYYVIPPGGGTATEFVVPSEPVTYPPICCYPIPWYEPDVEPWTPPPADPLTPVIGDPPPVPTVVTFDPQSPRITVRSAVPDQQRVVPLPPAAAFAGFPGAVRTAVADVNGDGVTDTIYVTGAGDARLTVVSGADGSVLVRDFRPYEDGFTGGMYVAAGDLDGDGVAEVVVSPDAGGSARILVLRLAADGSVSTVASFYGIGDTNFRGGASVAVGDFNGDGVADLAVGAGDSGGPRVTLYAGPSVVAGTPEILADVFVLDDLDFRGGLTLAAVPNVGAPDGLAVGVGPGGPGPAVRVFESAGLLGGRLDPVAEFDPGWATAAVGTDGIDADGDGRPDVVAWSGDGTEARFDPALAEFVPTHGVAVG
jgi:uncharacterized delta-60 repeat protein